MKTEPNQGARTGTRFGLRWEAQRHAAFGMLGRTQKAVSSLRSATALQNFAPLLLCAFALIPFASPAATNDLTSALQKGLFEEEANHNLEAAAQAYQAVSAQFDKDRKLAATAIFRLGEVYRKQGKTNEATAQYERIVREFSDQQTLATLSQQNLAGIGAKGEPFTSLALSRGARREQKQLLETEIKLVEQDLAELKRQLESGVVPQSAIRAKEREILKLRQQSAALDVDGEEVSADTSARASVTDDEEKEIRRIQAMIQNSPDLINAPGEGGYTPLCRAASAGWLRVATFLLDGGAAVNRVSQNSTALHLAAAGGHKAMIELLARRGADLNAHDGTGATPLHLAAEKGFLSIAEALVELKADLGARNNKANGERTPLHRAVERGHPAMAAFLISKGADIEATDSKGSTPLMMAAVAGHTEILRKLLAAGAKPDTRDTSGSTALMSAAAYGNGEIVQALLTAKANPDLVDNQGRTALSKAVQNGHTEVAKSLLAAKANPNAGTTDSPLLSAVRAESVELAELLLRAGADPNQATDCGLYTMVPAGGSATVPGTLNFARSAEKRRLATGQRGKRTPLQAAVLEDHGPMLKMLLQFKGDAKAKGPEGFPLVLSALDNTEMLKTLLEAGADANASDGNGRYALILAASAGHSAAVDLLLAHGAKTEVRGQDGSTPLLATVNAGCSNCVASLLAAGADVNTKLANDWSAVHSATVSGRKAILQMLLAKGANPNVRNKEGRTPLDLVKPQPDGFGNASIQFNPARPGEEPRASFTELADLLRQHGALDDLPDFSAIRATRQGFERPLVVFRAGTNGLNRFTLIETLLTAQSARAAATDSSFSGRAQELVMNASGTGSFPFPDFANVIIHRPARQVGVKEQELKVNALNAEGRLDCAKDVPLEPGDVVEIPERIHGLDEIPVNPLTVLETELQAGVRQIPTRALRQPPGAAAAPDNPAADSVKRARERMACLFKTVQLVVRDQKVSLTVFAPKTGWLANLLEQPEARAVLRSSSDLTRLRFTRKDGGHTRELTADGVGDTVWLQDGDVIEVPDKP